MKEVLIKNTPHIPAPENDFRAKPNCLLGPRTPLGNPPQERPANHMFKNIGAGCSSTACTVQRRAC